jgi:N-methylhydantoinase A
VSASLPGAEVSLGDAQRAAEPERGERPATLDGRTLTFTTLRGPASPGTEIEGPCVIELPESTLLVPPGWSGEVDDTATIHLRR